MKKRAKAGFTLVEMLCSVILVILEHWPCQWRAACGGELYPLHHPF